MEGFATLQIAPSIMFTGIINTLVSQPLVKCHDFSRKNVVGGFKTNFLFDIDKETPNIFTQSRFSQDTEEHNFEKTLRKKIQIFST